MESEPDLREQYRKLEEIIGALRNHEVDTVIGTTGIFMLRVKETEDALREQYRWLESLLAERTKLIEDLRAQQDLLEKQNAIARINEERLVMATSFPSFILAENDVELRYTWVQNPHKDFDKAQIIGKRDDEILCAENAKQLVDIKNQVLQAAEPRHFDFSVNLSDGRHFYDMYLRPRFAEDGTVTGLSTAAIDITERKLLEAEMLEHREHLEKLVEERTEELRRLSHRLIDVQEKERNLIGSELHDQLGQYLTYTTLLIEQMERKHESPELTNAKAAVHEAIGKIRNLSSMLSPRLLRSDGLLIALASLVEEYERNTKIDVEFIHDAALHALPRDVALACYRIIQESFTNAARHAKADRLTLRLSSQKYCVRLDVRDDGVGFDPQRTEHSVGLTGMRERALALGGELKIVTGLGKGTRIAAEIPFAVEES